MGQVEMMMVDVWVVGWTTRASESSVDGENKSSRQPTRPCTRHYKWLISHYDEMAQGF